MKAHKVIDTLNENAYVSPEGKLSGHLEYNFKDIIDFIDKSAERHFTPADLVEFLNHLLETGASERNSISFIKHLFSVHPYMEEDLVNGGVYKDILDEFMNILQNEGGFDPRMN